MPKYIFSELIFNMQSRYKNSGFKLKNHIGLDTETYNGYVRLIADSTGEYKLISSFDNLINYLTNKKFRNSMNWFYNIQFDFDSIIKYLSKEEIIELYENKSLIYNKRLLTYIPKKYFGIKSNNNYYHFYDLFNFLEISLNKASKKYLNDEKLNIVDAERLNYDIQYWADNEELIIHYCLKDAKLTSELAKYFWDLIYNTINFNPKRPFSKGKLAEEYFISKCNIPTIENIPYAVLEIAYNHYRGGRFELLQKGLFDKVYEYDIKSAYPFEIAQLIDFSKGKWEKIKGFNDAYLGFYNCKIESMEPIISPFIMKIGSLSIYPNGKFKTILTNYEINTIHKLFPDIEIKVLNGYIFNPIQKEYPFIEEVNNLYYLKEKETDEDIKYIYKIILNALYGKTIQCIDKKAGKLFNPIYATLITSNTRLKLLKFLKSFDFAIALSTDSIHSIKPLKINKFPKLGDFDINFEGKGIYIMSDVYYLWNPKKSKSRFRGFMIKEDDTSTNLLSILQSMIHTNELKYSYKVTRPYHLGECLKEKFIKSRQSFINLNDINIFYEETKTIDFNGDKKRLWNREFNSVIDILTNNIQSIPLIIT